MQVLIGSGQVDKLWLWDDEDIGLVFASGGVLYNLRNTSVYKCATPKNSAKDRYHVISCTSLDTRTLCSLSRNDSIYLFKRSPGTCVFKLKCSLGFICPTCGAVKKTLQNFVRHSDLHKSKINLMCKVRQCLKLFENKYELRLHAKNCFNTCPYEGCKIKNKSNLNFDAHLRRHRRSLA